MDNIYQEVLDFMKNFKTICISSLDLNKQVLCSYAPIIQSKNGNYIYISELAEHFNAIKNNNENIEIMFLEDESMSSSILARKRLRFKTSAIEIHRNSDEFNEALMEFQNNNLQEEAIKIIKNMKDFHLFKLIFKQGRFVKGFGQAYDVLDQNTTLVNQKEHK